MSRKYKFADNDKLYFVSFAVNNWIDLFIRNEYRVNTGAEKAAGSINKTYCTLYELAVLWQIVKL